MTPGQSKIKEWRRDPVKFMVEELHATPDKWQAEALRTFADPRYKRISMQACVGPGKSCVEAIMGWNFLACYTSRGEHPNGAVMSITADNLADGLWKEMAVWQGRSKFLQRAFVWQKERIFSKQHPATWWLSARTWSRKANAEEQGRVLSGLHAKFILYLLDEAGDIAPPILRTAEQGLSNCEWGKIVMAGNPTSQNGCLYLAAVTQRDMWYVIPVTGDPEDQNRSPRIDLEWAKAQINLYGRDNPWVMAHILGKFPPSGINTLLTLEEVQAAMSRHIPPDQYAFSQKRLGIDAAGSGLDPWVIWPRQGLMSFWPVEMRNPKSEEVAARIIAAKLKWGSEMELFDDTGGWSKGAQDAMSLAGYNVIPINFSGKSIDPRYFNRRSEMAFIGADSIKRGAALPNMPEIVREFTEPMWWLERGKFRLEEKDQIKKRLGHSTDYFDAYALTHALPDAPGVQPGSIDQLIQDAKNRRNHSNVDWDPFEPMRL